jgi:hypothetical protein
MKRFYSTIIEATSGMGFYAVRLEEAAKMLKYLSNMMGETAGKELFNTLTNTWTRASTESRLKEILTTGQHNMARIFKDVAEAEAEYMYGDLTAKLEDKKMWEKAGYTSGKELAKRLSEMTDEEREDLIMRMTTAKRLGGLGYEAEMGQRMDNLIDTLRAGQGDLNAMVEAMGTVGPAGSLAALTQSQVFGGRMLHEFIREEGVAGRAAAENLTGYTGKQLDALIDASQTTSAQMKWLLDLQEKVRKGEKKISQEEMALMAEQMGAVVTVTGEIRQATYDAARREVGLGTTIEDTTDLMLAQNNKYEKAAEQAVSEDIELARRIAKSTEKLSNVMDATVVKWLNKIWTTLYDFYERWSFKIFGKDKGEQGRLAAQNRLQTTYQRAASATRDNNLRIQELSKAMAEEKDPIKKKALEQKMEALVDANENLQVTMERAESSMDVFREMRTKGKDEMEIFTEIADTMKEKGRTPLTMTGVSDKILQEGLKKVREEYGKGVEGKLERGDVAGAVRELAAGYTALATGPTSAGQKVALDKALMEVAKSLPEGVSAKDFYEAMERATEKEVHGWALEFDEVKAIDRETNERLKDIDATTAEHLQAQKDLNARDIIVTGDTKKARDLILPAGGGAPIITDVADTIVAARPGGPIDRATSARRDADERRGAVAGTVNINVYGGDQKKVYETVMRALKATGNA